MAEEYKPWTWVAPEPVGKRGLPCKDGYEKATGTAVYASDVYLPGMLYAKMLASPYAHAKIISMDTTKAEALPGVVDILKWDDPDIKDQIENNIPSCNIIRLALPGTSDFYDHNMGVAVVAESEEVCDRALRLIDIQWEERPFIYDGEEAIKPDAPRICTELLPAKEANIYSVTESEEGDVEEGFREADKIIEFRVDREETNPAGAEPLKAVAVWRGDYLEVWARHQAPHHIHHTLNCLAPAANIDYTAVYNGAMFGGITWMGLSPLMARIAAILSKRVGKAVRLEYDESNFYCLGEEYGAYNFKIGVKNDGTLTAAQSDCVTWTSHLGKLHNASILENIKEKNIYPVANRGEASCYRDGACECIGFNSVVTHAAAELGMDPPYLP